MLAVHKKSRRNFFIFLSIVSGACLGFSYINVFLNNAYELNLKSGFLWLFVFPIHILLIIYGSTLIFLNSSFLT